VAKSKTTRRAFGPAARRLGWTRGAGSVRAAALRAVASFPSRRRASMRGLETPRPRTPPARRGATPPALHSRGHFVDVKLALLADGANATAEGKLNILGIFNALHAASFPCAHPHMCLVLRFE